MIPFIPLCSLLFNIQTLHDFHDTLKTIHSCVKCHATFYAIKHKAFYIKKFHDVIISRVFHMLFNMMHPFLNETVKKEVVFHSGDIASTLKEYFR